MGARRLGLLLTILAACGGADEAPAPAAPPPPPPRSATPFPPMPPPVPLPDAMKAAYPKGTVLYLHAPSLDAIEAAWPWSFRLVAGKPLRHAVTVPNARTDAPWGVALPFAGVDWGEATVLAPKADGYDAAATPGTPPATLPDGLGALHLDIPPLARAAGPALMTIGAGAPKLRELLGAVERLLDAAESLKASVRAVDGEMVLDALLATRAGGPFDAGAAAGPPVLPDLLARVPPGDLVFAFDLDGAAFADAFALLAALSASPEEEREFAGILAAQRHLGRGTAASFRFDGGDIRAVGLADAKDAAAFVAAYPTGAGTSFELVEGDPATIDGVTFRVLRLEPRLVREPEAPFVVDVFDAGWLAYRVDGDAALADIEHDAAVLGARLGPAFRERGGAIRTDPEYVFVHEDREHDVSAAVTHALARPGRVRIALVAEDGDAAPPAGSETVVPVPDAARAWHRGADGRYVLVEEGPLDLRNGDIHWAYVSRALHETDARADVSLRIAPHALDRARLLTTRARPRRLAVLVDGEAIAVVPIERPWTAEADLRDLRADQAALVAEFLNARAMRRTYTFEASVGGNFVMAHERRQMMGRLLGDGLSAYLGAIGDRVLIVIGDEAEVRRALPAATAPAPPNNAPLADLAALSAEAGCVLRFDIDALARGMMTMMGRATKGGVGPELEFPDVRPAVALARREGPDVRLHLRFDPALYAWAAAQADKQRANLARLVARELAESGGDEGPDPWGTPYRVEEGRAVSAGPDGEFGTEDDIAYPDD